MRIKLDENLHTSLAAILAAHGHDVDTVADEDLLGADDRSVLAAAVEEGRLVITADRGFGDIRRYPPGSHPGVLVLRLKDQSLTAGSATGRAGAGAGGVPPRCVAARPP